MRKKLKSLFKRCVKAYMDGATQMYKGSKYMPLMQINCLAAQ